MMKKSTLALIGILAASALPAANPPLPETNNPTASFEFTQLAAPPTEPLTLWYRQPATKWATEALPVGNGRLAAMVFGGIERERIQFNEETVWDGAAGDRNNPEALAALPEVRRLLFDGKNAEATTLAAAKMMGNPTRIKSYQTMGDLLLKLSPATVVTGYRRDLDLTTGIARVSYGVGGVRFTREVFVSAPDQVIVIRLTADRPGQVNFTATRARNDAITEAVSPNRLILRGQLGVKYEAQLQATVSGGTLTAKDGALDVANADSVTLLLAGATSYINANDISGDATARCAQV